MSRSRRSGSENINLSNANIGENLMPRKPKGSFARFVHGRDGGDQVSRKIVINSRTQGA
ncbi:hypothetical protein CXB51_024943 [Gossypium anomalum]|uniref:Uncharacterized protein n=1 Tax=Gossypium anomalum TaxID=47600 RepID=A0A8J5Z244_9ROSI|nr:hypothetical protein CXB51_024943 [Gossypium anomalum]